MRTGRSDLSSVDRTALYGFTVSCLNAVHALRSLYQSERSARRRTAFTNRWPRESREVSARGMAVQLYLQFGAHPHART
eukprot:856682-Prymnesium_polylepis.1